MDLEKIREKITFTSDKLTEQERELLFEAGVCEHCAQEDFGCACEFLFSGFE